MDFSNMDWGFLISVASAMVATMKIVFTVYHSGKDSKKRAKLEHHELFRLFKRLKSQVDDNSDLDKNLKIAIIELMVLIEEEWSNKQSSLRSITDTGVSTSDIRTMIENSYIELMEKTDIRLTNKNLPRKYITHILSCLKTYKANFRGDVDYIIFSDAHTDRYQMAVMLMDMTTAILTSSVPDLINVGGDNESH
jgi:hypothetical protein